MSASNRTNIPNSLNEHWMPFSDNKNFKKNVQVASLKNITLSFGERKILDKINIDIYPGEILGLLGPNGVGKSTLFNLLIGLLKPNSGQIFINSKNVSHDIAL